MEFNLTIILFYAFSLLTVVSAVAVIAAKNPVYSVLWLIFAFFNSAGLFLLLGAEMLAMLLVIVYVGAVAVLFLFVVMMLNIKAASLKKGFQAYLPVGLLLAATLFIEIVAITYNSSKNLNIAKSDEIRQIVQNENIANDPKLQKEVTEGLEQVSEDREVTAEEQELEVDKNTNAHQIGKVMYTEYILYFQTSGLILFVAMIGAIVLTLRDRGGVLRRQKIADQYKRNMKNSLKIVKVETGEGVE